jgi:hypothetical protein
MTIDTQTHPTPRYGVTAASLVTGAALMNGIESIGMRVLLPARPDDTIEMLQQVADHQTTYAVLTVVGTLAVPLMAAAFVVMTRVAAPRARRTAAASRALLLAGMWGFLGMHVVNLTQVPLSDPALGGSGAAALEAIEQSPVFGLMFLLPFLVGTTLGLLLLAVGLLRNRVPRWVPLTMLAFLVVDFGLRNSGPVDAHWLWIAASLGMARLLVRTDGYRAPVAADPAPAHV